MAAVLWALPLMAAGLVALLRYGFGSLFVVGESVAEVLLRSAGADIAGTVGRMQTDPAGAALTAAAGLAPCIAAAAIVYRRPGVAVVLALASAGWGWWSGLPWAIAPLGLAGVAGLIAAWP